jgi:hypothetical protein
VVVAFLWRIGWSLRLTGPSNKYQIGNNEIIVISPETIGFSRSYSAVAREPIMVAVTRSISLEDC